MSSAFCGLKEQAHGWEKTSLVGAGAGFPVERRLLPILGSLVPQSESMPGGAELPGPGRAGLPVPAELLPAGGGRAGSAECPGNELAALPVSCERSLTQSSTKSTKTTKIPSWFSCSSWMIAFLTRQEAGQFLTIAPR
jgi:hypothetical protein